MIRIIVTNKVFHDYFSEQILNAIQKAFYILHCLCLLYTSTYYFIALTIILIYAMYNVETAKEMIDMLIKSMSLVLDKM